MVKAKWNYKITEDQKKLEGLAKQFPKAFEIILVPEHREIKPIRSMITKILDTGQRPDGIEIIESVEEEEEVKNPTKEPAPPAGPDSTQQPKEETKQPSDAVVEASQSENLTENWSAPAADATTAVSAPTKGFIGKLQEKKAAAQQKADQKTDE